MNNTRTEIIIENCVTHIDKLGIGDYFEFEGVVYRLTSEIIQVSIHNDSSMPRITFHIQNKYNDIYENRMMAIKVYDGKSYYFDPKTLVKKLECVTEKLQFIHALT